MWQLITVELADRLFPKAENSTPLNWALRLLFLAGCGWLVAVLD
jgi:hypothetical protein